MFRYIFGIPGEENLDLLDSLRNSKIKLVVTRHEQAAGFMAATVGRLTGKAGCCLSTLGPGATNFATAAAYAQLAGFPMVTIIKPYEPFSVCLIFCSTLTLSDSRGTLLVIEEDYVLSFLLSGLNFFGKLALNRKLYVWGFGSR